MSGECTPMLSGTYPAFETLIEWWKSLAIHIPHCSPLVQIGLTWADKYDDRMGATNTYVVTMCESGIFFEKLVAHESQIIIAFIVVDPAIRMSWVRSRWEEQLVEDVEKHIINLVRLSNLQQHNIELTLSHADASKASHEQFIIY
jgi:hypothetical protein